MKELSLGLVLSWGCTGCTRVTEEGKIFSSCVSTGESSRLQWVVPQLCSLGQPWLNTLGLTKTDIIIGKKLIRHKTRWVVCNKNELSTNMTFSIVIIKLNYHTENITKTHKTFVLVYLNAILTNKSFLKFSVSVENHTCIKILSQMFLLAL